MSEEINEVPVVLALAAVPFATHYLQQQHAKAEHVGLDREDALGSVLRRHVTTSENITKRATLVVYSKIKKPHN
jgi:hypothetical protein